jgi:hypothetical protein
MTTAFRSEPDWKHATCRQIKLEAIAALEKLRAEMKALGML